MTIRYRYLVISESEGPGDDPDTWTPIVATSDPEVIRATMEALESRICAGSVSGDSYQYPAPEPE